MVNARGEYDFDQAFATIAQHRPDALFVGGDPIFFSRPTPRGPRCKGSDHHYPIVVPNMGDPVGDGLVASLARPGGNITGMTFLGPQLVTKGLDLLKQALPTISRVAALWHPGVYGESTTREMIRKTEAAARTLLVQLQLVEVREAAEFDQAFLAMVRERADAPLTRKARARHQLHASILRPSRFDPSPEAPHS